MAFDRIGSREVFFFENLLFEEKFFLASRVAQRVTMATTGLARRCVAGFKDICKTDKHCFHTEKAKNLTYDAKVSWDHPDSEQVGSTDSSQPGGAHCSQGHCCQVSAFSTRRN